MERPSLRQSASSFSRAIAVITATIFFGGCGSSIHEKHYFATFHKTDSEDRAPTQFFRVNVDGSAFLANARYLTGYYDDRAVSLFFNELKGSSTSKLFLDDQKNPGTDTKLTALNPDAGQGSFVLIMSTNADSIASTIGSFAESQIVADALTNLVNTSNMKAKVKSDASLVINKSMAEALFSRVDTQLKAAAEADSGTAAAAAYRRALTALAQGLGYNGPEFTSTAEAQAWFTLAASREGAEF